MTQSFEGWLSRTGITSGTLCSAVEYGLPLPFLLFILIRLVQSVHISSLSIVGRICVQQDCVFSNLPPTAVNGILNQSLPVRVYDSNECVLGCESFSLHLSSVFTLTLLPLCEMEFWDRYSVFIFLAAVLLKSLTVIINIWVMSTDFSQNFIW